MPLTCWLSRSRRLASRAMAHTSMPSPASASTMARPSPRLPPVTSAVLLLMSSHAFLLCVVTKAQAIGEPLVEEVVLIGQLTDLDGAAMGQDRAPVGQIDGRVQAGGADQRVAAQGGAGGAGADCGCSEGYVAAVLKAGAQLQLPFGPAVEGAGRGGVVSGGAEREQVGGHELAGFLLRPAGAGITRLPVG